MTKANQLVKTSSLIYLIGAFAIIPYETILGGILLTVGVLLLSYSFLSIEDLISKKGIITALAILAIFLGAIPAVFLFMAVDEISSYKKNSMNSPPEDEITSEAKRIDLLLKIGLGGNYIWYLIRNFNMGIVPRYFKANFTYFNGSWFLRII